MHLRQFGDPVSMTHREFREAAKWALERLVSPRRAQNVKLYVHHKRPPGAKGDCVGWYWDGKFQHFTIRIRPFVRPSTTLRVLFHELAHVKQFVMGEMADYADGKYVRWKGRYVKDETLETYEKVAWERDAVRHERRLVAAWNRHLKTR